MRFEGKNKIKLILLFVLLGGSGLLVYLFSTSFFISSADSVIGSEIVQQSPAPARPTSFHHRPAAENLSVVKESIAIAPVIQSPELQKTPLTEQEIAHAEFEEYMQQPEQVLWREQTFFEFDRTDPYFTMDLAELEQKASDGSVYAKIVLGNRLVHTDIDPEQGVEWLIEAASYGSQLALSDLRGIYMMGAGPIESDEFAYAAWGQVSYMLGDWHAMWPFGRAAMRLIDVRESILVDVMAANYYAEINRRHLERTGRSIEPNLRPGYAEALDHFIKYGWNDP